MAARITDGLTLNGTVDVNAKGVLSFIGSPTLGGNGTIVLGSSGASDRALSMQGDTVLTLGAGITVRGQNGSFGQACMAGGNQRIITISVPSAASTAASAAPAATR